MRPRLAGWLALSAAFCMAFAPGVPAQSKTRGVPPARQDTAKYEAWLSEKVRHELVMLPWLGVFDHLAFTVQGERVTLMGYTIRPSIRSSAENIVKKIEGVRQVVNNIEILPPSPHDDSIRRNAYRAIFGDPALGRYAIQPVPSIHIIVRRGHIILEGSVSNQTDKNIAGLRASSVPESFSITNNLRVVKSK
jgi:hyperosmotically inducible protein